MSIRVGGQQDPFGVRLQGSRLFQKLRAVHLRHLLIDQQERYWLVAQAHLFQLIQRLLTRIGRDDAKAVAILLFQVVLKLLPDLGDIINDNDGGFYHVLLPIWAMPYPYTQPVGMLINPYVLRCRAKIGSNTLLRN